MRKRIIDINTQAQHDNERELTIRQNFGDCMHVLIVSK